jgi:hypothetical protein
MIGVIAKPNERRVVEEFFELFKTPWEFYCPEQAYEVVLNTTSKLPKIEAGLVLVYGSQPGPMQMDPPSKNGTLLTLMVGDREVECLTSDGQCVGFGPGDENTPIVRIGYDLFFEIEQLLTAGQPLEHAEKPTLELHIELLRTLILKAGIPLVEIPPTPANCAFAVCLTHDIDFVGIRRHKFDHTMWGFLLRATVGTFRDFLRGRTSGARLFASWRAAASLPLVYLGLAKDFWMPFDWYLKVEAGLSPTYFFIPFKGRQGEKVAAKNPERRASGYDISDVPEWLAKLQAAGCEVGVHGVDAWHDVEKGRAELRQVSAVAGQPARGIRMHWLLQDEKTCEVLEQAGYGYDSTAGYNETPGYRCGTVQTFRPLTTSTLLELPLHIQDGALFYAKRLGLSESEAWAKCETFIQNGLHFGGVLTVLWHDRSFAAERFWGDFYVRLIARLKTLNVWFANASDLVSWFRERRAITFDREPSSRIRIKSGGPMRRGVHIRVHRPTKRMDKMAAPKSWQTSDTVWNGTNDFELDLTNARTFGNQKELLQTALLE